MRTSTPPATRPRTADAACPASLDPPGSVARLVLADDTAPAEVAALLNMSVAELLAMDNLRAGERIRGAAAPAIDVACAVLQWPDLASFAPVLPKPKSAAGTGGRKMDYPPLLMLIYAVLERVFRSGTQVDAEMRYPFNWLRFRMAYHQLTGVWLREEPMAWANYEYYRNTYLAPKHRKGEPIDTGIFQPDRPTVLQQLIHHLGVVSVELVRALGGFPDEEIDLQDPNPLNALHGDGSQKKSNSGVREFTDIFADGTTETRLYGSRARKGKPRVQRVFTDTAADGKTGDGLNMVGLYWRHPELTDSRVVLFVGMAPGAEVNVALPAVRQVHGLIGDALHFLVYDGLFTGEALDELLVRYGIVAFNKAPKADTSARATGRKANPTRRPDVVLDELKIATHDADGKPIKKSSDRARLRTAEYQREVSAVLADQKHRDPVGQRTYFTKTGKAVQKPTEYSYLAPARHKRSDGTVCEHQLVADDTALWEWEFDSAAGENVKLTREPVERLAASRLRDTAGYYLRLDYRMPCEHGDFSHRIELRPALGAARRPNEPSRLLRALPEAYAEAFHAIFDVRNDAEGANSAYNATLYIQGRAQSLDAHAQLLDWLAWALLNNALTYVHHLGAGLEAGHKPKKTRKPVRTAA
ncbi:hypothetical protein [Blastococcus sp. CCUG 61487]|uniref:hypothetical protein n=1 Tax=Blastococcus sp. CCUG 61487 TaxID=1840703 RepID=UPI0010C09247|nr:hypothetical protein [Blastococcus sp. CCUG 61487]